jgi:glycosyltransferase involved in cell wall biosynthesis
MRMPPAEAAGPHRRLRWLVVSSDTYPPTRVDVAVLFGVELGGRGHRTDLILQSEAACASSFMAQWAGGSVWVGATDLGGSILSRIRKHVLGIANDLRMFSRLRTGSYDALEVKDKFLSGVLAWLACRLSGKPFVYWLSYPFPEHYLLRAKDGTARYPLLYRVRGRTFEWLLYRCLLPAADHVFVQSEEMRRQIGARGIPLDKMTAVPMGVRVDQGAPGNGPAERRVLPKDVPCVLYLGALGRLRHLDFLVRAFAHVQAAIPHARLYFVGQGDHPEDRTFLAREVARHGLDSSVVFAGQVPQPEALAYVRESDVCVSPIFPTPVLQVASVTKLIEYMAMSKAVVANDHPEQRQVIEESGAGICVPWEEPTFGAAIVRLLKDPEEARRMGERGRRYVIEQRAYGIIADKVERRMLDIVEGRC